MNTAHGSHCCKKHGCKYGDSDCTVILGKEKQEGKCYIGYELKDDCFSNFYDNVRVELTAPKLILSSVTDNVYAEIDITAEQYNQLKNKLGI